MVVECYLEPGNKYRLSLYESVSYLKEPRLPVIYGAEVYITHNLDTVRLFNALVERTDTNVGYNYMSNRKVPFDYNSDFNLFVKDAKGRVVTSVCRIPKPFNFSSASYGLNERQQAFLSFKILSSTDKYFRIFTNKNFLSFETMKWQQIFKSEKEVDEVYSPYVYEKGDSVIVTLVSLEKQYFDFLNTFKQATISAIDPFSQPINVESNINGGLGIFAGYSYTRQKLYIK